MPKKSIAEPVYDKQRDRWRVSIPASLSASNKRVRSWHKTREAARAYIVGVAREEEPAAVIPPMLAMKADEARAILEPYGLDLVEAAREVANALKTLDGAGSIQQAAKEYRVAHDTRHASNPLGESVTLYLKSRENLRDSTLKSYKYSLDNIIVPVEYREVHENAFPHLRLPLNPGSAAPEQQPTAEELRANYDYSLEHTLIEDPDSQSAACSLADPSDLDLIIEFAGILITNDDDTILVDARRLHQKLEPSRNFSSWMKQQAQGINLILDCDYGLLPSRMGRKGCADKRKDYWLKLDAAKLVALMEESDQGKRISRYLREILERQRDEAKCKAMITGVQDILQKQQQEGQSTVSRGDAIMLKCLIGSYQLLLQVLHKLRIGEQELYETVQQKRKSASKAQIENHIAEVAKLEHQPDVNDPGFHNDVSHDDV